LGLPELQAVQGAFARHRIATVTDARASLSRLVWFANEQREQRLLAQAVVIIEVLIASGEGIDALFDQGFHWVLHAARGALIGKAGRTAAQDAALAFNFP
jgi:hypothetical protein